MSGGAEGDEREKDGRGREVRSGHRSGTDCGRQRRLSRTPGAVTVGRVETDTSLEGHDRRRGGKWWTDRDMATQGRVPTRTSRSGVGDRRRPPPLPVVTGRTLGAVPETHTRRTGADVVPADAAYVTSTRGRVRGPWTTHPSVSTSTFPVPHTVPDPGLPTKATGDLSGILYHPECV